MLNSQITSNMNWKYDLEVYKRSLEQKHIDLYHSITRQDFEDEWYDIYNSVDTLTDFDIILKLMRLTRKINDGHTALSLRNITTNRFPIEFRLIDNRWYVAKVSHENKDLLLMSLQAIDDIPVNEIITKVSEVAQFVENQYSQKIRTGEYLNISELLFALHITNKEQEAVFTFLDTNNQEIKIKLKALDKDILSKTSDFALFTTGVSEITRPNQSKFPYLWFTPIKSTEALYINFENYPAFEDMQIFGETLVNYIAKNQNKQVVIDMRNNGGGDLYVGIFLAYALNLADSIDWKNGVFVLTSNKTFSAATSNAVLYKQLLNAKIVGESTGSNPSGYQDMDSFTLPKSKLVITYSKRLFRLSNQLNTAVQPDIILLQKEDDYLEGIDTVLRVLIDRFKSSKK